MRTIKDDERDDDAAEDAAAFGLKRGLLGSEGLVGDDVGVGEMGKAHGLMASVNGGEWGSSSGIAEWVAELGFNLFYWSCYRSETWAGWNGGRYMGSGESLHAVETVILLLLVLVAGFAVLARRLKVPYPIVLVLAGLVISFVPRMPRVPLDPNVVFVVFLPPLLYASAWTMSWREFRRNGVVIGLLAVGLVGFTVWGVAEFSDRFITALDWKAGISAGSGGFDDGCDCSDVDCEEHRAAAEDRRHP